MIKQFLHTWFKQKQLGAILGSISNFQDHPMHCSPLLTRPKSTDKRCVIIDISFPKDLSLNDQIDRDLFDASAFTLKFPSVDDEVQEISW